MSHRLRLKTYDPEKVSWTKTRGADPIVHIYDASGESIYRYKIPETMDVTEIEALLAKYGFEPRP